MQEIDVKKLFEVALDQVVSLEEGLDAFARLIRGSYELRQTLENPLVPAKQKKKLFQELFPGALTIFRDLVFMLIDEGLEKSIGLLADELTKMVSERLKITFVNVESPYPLGKREQARLRALVGGNVSLRVEINKTLIGGIRFLTSDGRFFDGTLKGRLDKMREALAYA